MDQRERIADQEEALRVCVEGILTATWNALPAVVQSYNALKGTCVLQTSVRIFISRVDEILPLDLRAKARAQAGWLDLPPLVDVPVVYQGGGQFVVTFPIAAGDEALVVFASRCIDNWWLQGGTANTQAELRMHDLSDGFAIIGPRSQPRKLTAVSTTTTQIRTVDGTAYIELTTDGKINLKAPGGVHVTGTLDATGEITASGTHTVSAHTHSDPQGGNTGGPTG